MTVLNQRIRLASRPVGVPKPEDFLQDEVPIPEPREGELLLRTLYLSLDPYMRGRMSDAKSYAKPLAIGDVMVGGTVAEIVVSKAPGFRAGQLVVAYGGWQSFSIAKPRELRVLDPDAAPVTTALGVLGMPGFTAYAGLLAIGRPREGETVAVAAASGPVGATVGQLAKLNGCTAVGIAGGPEKVAYLKTIGFDVALDHRAGDLRASLKEAVPQGIDVYFENVGGAVWDAVLPRLNTYARVPVCGLAATYNATKLPEGPDRSGALMGQVLTKSLLLRGFIQSEFYEALHDDFLRDMTRWVRVGKVKYREDITEGLERAPEVFAGMLQGRNFGKAIIKVAD